MRLVVLYKCYISIAFAIQTQEEAADDEGKDANWYALKSSSHKHRNDKTLQFW